MSMVTYTTGQNNVNNSWGGNWDRATYLLLEPHSNIVAMEEKFPAFMSRHMDNPDINTTYKLFLQRLDDVHLTSNDIEHDYINYRKFNGSYLTIFYVIAGFILLIAAVNFTEPHHRARIASLERNWCAQIHRGKKSSTVWSVYF